MFFHAGNERFEFWQPIKMKDDPYWFSVTEVMQAGPGGLATVMSKQLAHVALGFQDQLEVSNCLGRLLGIDAVDLPVQQIADDGLKEDTVVDIFNRLNSAGTRLTKADLALARISARWPNIRRSMRQDVKKWRRHNFTFTLDWLLRCLNAVMHGEAVFQHLHDAQAQAVQKGLKRTVKHVDAVLNQISTRLGLDHDRVLFGRYAIPVMIRHMELRPTGMMGSNEWDLLLYWYLHAGMQGRFSGTTEAKIRQDLVQVDGTVAGLEQLIGEIGTKWGKRRVSEADFDSWSLGARGYPVMYWLARVGGARNFCDGIQLKKALLGAQLEVHHIFPKALLYKHGYTRPQVNALGNLCFLTDSCNKYISAKPPGEEAGKAGYLAQVEEKNPGVLKSQWIPMDEELWKVHNYLAFLEARRKLLAGAANKHLQALYPQHAEGSKSVEAPTQWDLAPSVSSPDEEKALQEVRDWMSAQGLHSGKSSYELSADTGEFAAILDLAWPNGLPGGRGEPVALLLNEPAETYRAAIEAGFKCYLSVQDFKQYVINETCG